MKDTEKDSVILLKSLTYEEIYVQNQTLYSENDTFKKKIEEYSQNASKQDGKIWKMSDIAKLKSWEFEKLEKEIDLARAEGRITQ